ncbi:MULTISPECIES: bifunctional 3-deoxy-7-phosphoheptulonate synthase/chorismate mutase type II [Apibacter]|uniref:bifunctional 3-deoxy-7-phosphoheptulonate synthase/chorismate mutase type II n=1 Tax=Apibacter TaxID=1778601 RepID=UPI000CF936AD|nr:MULTISPECIES: bifunctional 3-deoxy-7-phosphoheptulonate synthase/chorismate mutase type II [Apibacter]MCX8676509.1 bifunctional 3-deoxy-7-phosphoheptulonate synthase/chorismate mutase type II [Apibacter sp. B3919]MXO23972.1 3-deoxy-7-phosphoheptulonate synthase [Apibacter sp. B3924]MXO26351.1 3-deoxy-7-phosphoheptulonate synthase [Apibacter sp. B3813]MXO28302.1 3-deoxy-7-phosphoheptulonate synthase [Apibacter sp. B3913]MXO30256.1 3-deoxy-7-phosphoheptulonate synthase [Apibacter sp. B3912]
MSLQDLDQNWIKQFEKPLVIAGPCSAESEKQVMEIAERMDRNYMQVFRAGIWKPRTKPGSFEGVGAIGLNWLKRVKDEFNMPIATEVANASHAKLALEFDVDYLWIGARSTVNPFTIQEIAESLRDTDKIVLVKNPVNPDLDLWIGALERLAAQGIKNLGVIHRGFSSHNKSKYRNNPQWQIALELKDRFPNIPILGDPSHITGRRDLIAEVAQQAFNLEYNGLMVEVHNNPDEAWSDAKQQITPEALKDILVDITLRKKNDNSDDFSAKLNRYRGEIDELDNQLLGLLAARMDVAKKIGNLKKEHNVAIFQPDRWNVLKNLAIRNGERMGLSEDFLEHLLVSIHKESVELQNKIMEE